MHQAGDPEALETCQSWAETMEMVTVWAYQRCIWQSLAGSVDSFTSRAKSVAVPTLLHLQCTKEMLGLHQTPNETTDSRRLYKVRTHGLMDHPWTIHGPYGCGNLSPLACHLPISVCLRVKALTSVCMCLGRNGGWGGYRDIQKSHWLVPKTWGPIADPIAAQVASGCCCAWHGLQPLFRWCPLGLCRGGHPCCMLDTVVMSQLYHPGLALWIMMMSVASLKRAVPHEFRHNMATWEHMGAKTEVEFWI